MTKKGYDALIKKELKKQQAKRNKNKKIKVKKN